MPLHQLKGLPLHLDLEAETLSNQDYRRVLYTDHNLQLVLMSLLPLQEIGLEVHPHTTQFIRVEEGTGVTVVNNTLHTLNNGEMVIVPYGYWHNVRNLSRDKRLQLYTIYSPPEHPPDLVQHLKP